VPEIFSWRRRVLLNVVLPPSKRTQVAALKALGYSNREVAWHYVKSSLAIALLGAVFGVAVGAWFGWAMTRMYTLFFHFPILLYRLSRSCRRRWPSMLGGPRGSARSGGARLAPAEARLKFL
jgi:putative ABC transport system permease protein